MRSMFAAAVGRSSRLPAWRTTLTWLGHAAFRVDTPGGKRIYVDPFLNGNPKCPENEREPERVDAIFITHGHDDHVGDTVDAGAEVRVPGRARRSSSRDWLARQGCRVEHGRTTRTRITCRRT